MHARHTIARVALVAANLIMATGCSTISIGNTHVSHPLKGYPFGPSNEEDTLDTVDLTGVRESGPWRLEATLGYVYADGGFYGDDFVFIGRVAYKIWEKD